jgi:2,6-dihydroxypseudooxynicotine hydrolase
MLFRLSRFVASVARTYAAVPDAAAATASRLRLGLISEGTNTWPLYVAQSLRLFEREGIDVEVALTGSSVDQQAQLISGRFEIGFQQADHVVRAVEHGSDLFIFMPLGHAPDLTLVAAAEVKRIEDLRGRTVAVDGARTGYALLLRRLLREHGLAESDVSFREVGGSKERFDAMKTGEVAASLLNPPFDANLVAQGFVALARMNEAFPTYPGPVMAARRSWASTHERELLAFIRAYDAAVSWLEDPSHEAEAVKMLPPRLAIAPQAALIAYQKLASRGRPRVTADGIRQVIDTYWDAEQLTTPKTAPDTYMTLSYAERALARTGATQRDSRVEAAIAHWAPRFIANGVPLADFWEVTAELERWEDWCAAWSRRAAVHERLGNEALVSGYRASAAEHYTRAGVCYHFAKFVFVHDQAEMRAAHMKAVECRMKALPHLDPPGERVEIRYENTRLYGNLRKPNGVAKPPIVVMCMGLDSAKEEMDAYESIFLARGMATLTFDGPGQGEAEYELGIRGDYEVVVKSVIDWVESRADVDGKRVGLWGVSLGGYYAPRAAAFEKRVRACIALSGPFDWSEDWPHLNALTREAFRVRAKCASVEAAREYGATLTLKGIASKITCPLYVVAGKLDRIVPWQDGERLAREAGGPVEFVLIEDGNHVANNRGYRYRTQSADWMARALGVAPS